VAAEFPRDAPARPEQIEGDRARGGAGSDLTSESHVQGVGAIVLADDPGPMAGLPRREPTAAVRQAVRAAVEAGLWPVVVVVGAGTDLIRGTLAGLPVVTCAGAEPGCAIRLGLARLSECAPGARAVVLLRCDGPPARAGHLDALAAAAIREGKPIAASAHDGALGVPALFAAALFPELARAGDPDGVPVLAADPGRVVRVDVGPSPRA
jgi:molybdenum cofactor cytidylyltransferase